MSQFQKNVLFISAAVIVVIAVSFGINFAVQEHGRRQAELTTAWKKENIRSLKALSGIGALSPEEQTRVDNAGDDVERLQQVLLDIHRERITYWNSQLEDISGRRKGFEGANTSYPLVRQMIQSVSDEEEKARANLKGFEEAEPRIRAWRPTKFEDYRPGSTGVAAPAGATPENSGTQDASSSPARPSPSTHPTSEPVQVPQGSLKSTRDLEKYVGTFPCGNGLLEETALLASLKQVLGSDYTAYREFMRISGCGAIEKKGEFLLVDVTEHHVGPGYSSLILVRLSDGQVFLLWINKAREADKQWQFYGPRPVPDEVGQIVENCLNEGLGGFVYDVKVTVHGEDFDVTGRH